MFKECKSYCDYLIVMLQDDPSVTDASYRGKKKNKPVMTLEERLEIVQGIKYIDEIITYSTEEDLYEKLKKTDHDIRILGADWRDKHATGQEFAKEVRYNSRNHGFSTTELRQRIYDAEKARIEKQEAEAERASYEQEQQEKNLNTVLQQITA